MLLGHWYLVVRGMAIDPLKRLAMATLAATIVKIAVVAIAIAAGGAWYELPSVRASSSGCTPDGASSDLCCSIRCVGNGKDPLDDAATGILYVDVVAVVIGEVLGAW